MSLFLEYVFTEDDGTEIVIPLSVFCDSRKELVAKLGAHWVRYNGTDYPVHLLKLRMKSENDEQVGVPVAGGVCGLAVSDLAGSPILGLAASVAVGFTARKKIKDSELRVKRFNESETVSEPAYKRLIRWRGSLNFSVQDMISFLENKIGDVEYDLYDAWELGTKPIPQLLKDLIPESI